MTDPERVVNIEFTSLVASRTKRGAVSLRVAEGDRMIETVMDLDKAREIHGMLGFAIEAAVSDQLLFQFLVERVGLPPEAAAVALGEFRELRQGSRGVVYPS